MSKMRQAAAKARSVSLAVALCCAALGSSPGYCAQPSTLSIEQQIEIARSMNEATRQSTMAANLDVSAEAADAFWPVYREYRSEVNALNDELKSIILRYAESYQDLSGDEAYQLADQTAKLQIRRDKLRQTYLKRFAKALSPRDAARAFQIENKLDALFQAMLASEIPLVNVESRP